MNAQQFIEHCQAVITDYEAGKMSLDTASAKINASAFEYPFEGPAHPMVYEVAELAFDIAEDYRSEKDNEADWTALTETLTNYIAGNWESTCWILGVMYGEYADQKLTHSYSVSIRRQNGETLVETASQELRSVVIDTVGKLNAEQTDERFLQNLAQLMPQKIDKYKLVSVELAEHLTSLKSQRL